ncbi:MAG TPA: 2-oxo-4-hydroxy-4-carboxy-5-ureidoimidazoline decarboxylase [Jatrophihabitans sp.]|nr:2-oxo-4-hydroxy-4-carboxy-5-ureidoimidazoline decarboxylase [Jatrophihabitans sp.]
MDIATFDALPEPEAERVLLGCCTSSRWARALAARRPYGSPDALLAAADAALADFDDADLDEALAGHPRIGERSASSASAREQAAVLSSDEAVLAALAEGNGRYEQRFGHVYLVCASGRSGAELLAVLTERLANDPATERVRMRAELGKINRIRLRQLVTEEECP